MHIEGAGTDQEGSVISASYLESWCMLNARPYYCKQIRTITNLNYHTCLAIYKQTNIIG